MSDSNRCQRCGSLLPQIGGLFGRCPECMLELGFDSAAERAGETGDDGEYPGTIGRYRILRLIGEGGMGAVYEAEQEHPARVVALKIIKPGMATPALLRRFEQEAEALGRLQHPGIAQIYEAGTVDTGFGLQPYFAMELIRGTSPLDYSETHKLSIRERLVIMAKICDAVHHAHQRGLIHRDLKPPNILVDEGGQPKVLDFGVARVTDKDSHATSQTDVGQLVGTLAYMSPEQVLADPLDIDTRSDVYALGVVLYQLLAGRLPYDIGRKIHETIQTIRATEPARLGSLNRECRGDIETIAAKALEKDKARRYESAAEMAADIQRYLSDQPIVAQPQSALYLLRKFRKRHRVLVAASAVVLLVLTAAATVSALMAVRASQALAIAKVNMYRNDINLADREWIDGNITRSDELLRETPTTLRNWEWNYLTRRNHEESATMAGHRGPIVALAFFDDGKRLRTVGSDQTFADWNMETRTEIATGRFGPTASSKATIFELSLSTDGRIISFLTPTEVGFRAVHSVWDLSAGREVFSFSEAGYFYFVVLSPDGKRLTADFYSVGERPMLRTWEIESRQETTRGLDSFLNERPVFSSDGSRLAVTRDNRTSIVNTVTGKRLSVLDNSKAIASPAFSSDGAVIAAGSKAQGVVAWRTADGKVLWAVPSGTVTNIAFSPDSTLIAIALTDRTIRILDAATGRQSSRLTGHTDVIRVLKFMPDGSHLVSAGDDKLVHIWKVGGSALDARVEAGPLQAPMQVAADGNTILLPTLTGLKLWDVNAGRFLLEVPLAAGQSGAGLNRDASLIAVMKSDGSNLHLEVTDTRTGRGGTTFHLADSRIVSPQERVPLASGGAWTNKRSDSWRLGDPHLSPLGDRMALLFEQAGKTHLDILETIGGKRTNVSRFDNALVGPLRFSPDGKRLAIFVETTSGEAAASHLEIYNAMTGKRLHRFAVSRVAGYPIVAWTEDGNQVAEVANGKTLTIWDVRSGAKVVSFPQFGNGVVDAAFSPDGTRLVTVSPSGEVWLWDSQAGKALLPLREDGGSYSRREVLILSESNELSTLARERSIAFDPTGRIIMTSVVPDPKGFKVRISTWDSSPQAVP